VQRALAHRLVIYPAAMDIQQLALAYHAQFARPFDKLSTFFPGLTHDEAFFKKSFSTLSCPIVLKRRSSLSSASLLASLALVAKTPSPFLRNCDFQLVICAG